MNELAVKVQMVMNTLQGLEIKSSVDNLTNVLGCLKALAEVQNEFQRIGAENQNGEADNE